MPDAGYLGRLQAHLQDLQAAPDTTTIDEKLFDTAGYVLLPKLNAETIQGLIIQVYRLLPTLQQDPTPVVRLLTKLLDPVPLSSILSLELPVDFVAGLNVAATPFNSLTLSLLEKADTSTARRLASTYQPLFIALVTLWLSTPDEGVADRASKVILSMLRVDRQDSGIVEWDGPVWKRIFRDKDVYETMFALTDLKSRKDTSLNKNQKTIAQARIMDWLPAVGRMDWVSITQSYHPEIESSYGLPDGQQSLLDYAASYMVEFKDDVLMHRSLINFFSNLLQVQVPSPTAPSAPFDFLNAHGLHTRTIAYYVQPDHPSHDRLDATFLYGPAARYVGSWATTYPQAFSANSQTRDEVIKRISQAVDISPSRWAHAQSPAEDLHVLSCLPRSFLVSLGGSSPLFSLPSRITSPDALHTLATLFHGPIDINTITYPPRANNSSVEDHDAELQAAHEIYYSYISRNDRLWSDITTHADTIALKDQALAATTLMKAVATAKWGGTQALTTPPARSTIIPWILAPPKMFSNLVGGHGDAESAAYKIAVAKFDLVKAFYERLGDGEDDKVVAQAVRARIAEGPWGSGEQQVGGRIATLDM
ncbi:hypothetical protein EJ08DRAFT_193201 [Tothia fuscella]|uniref:Uncharacterized protein n=1 Tax=Tothia fuscella TaxID=1048955 RepID=A0A9P4TZC2_9PEZI|nr:hypothetical protein EJ08DRAFT_193201 [Tothia fuscella]